jgi:outer membrane protein OmpA-like peptidoglycan-associated protein
MKGVRTLAAMIALSAALAAYPNRASAAWDDYDDSQSNPLRVFAYLAYPIGFTAEWLIFRPFHFLVSATPAQEAFFGHHPHPSIFVDPEPGYDFGVPKRVYRTDPPPRAAFQSEEPVAERVSVQQVPVDRIVIKEVSKVVEVERLVFPDIAFRFDSAELTDLGRGKVYLLAKQIKEKGDVVVAIEGHTDAVGTEEYNQKLGMRRAERVMKELADLGVDGSRLTVASFGKSTPLIDEKTDWARAVNRRVEFRITAADKQAADQK